MLCRDLLNIDVFQNLEKYMGENLILRRINTFLLENFLEFKVSL